MCYILFNLTQLNRKRSHALLNKSDLFNPPSPFSPLSPPLPPRGPSRLISFSPLFRGGDGKRGKGRKTRPVLAFLGKFTVCFFPGWGFSLVVRSLFLPFPLFRFFPFPPPTPSPSPSPLLYIHNISPFVRNAHVLISFSFSPKESPGRRFLIPVSPVRQFRSSHLCRSQFVFRDSRFAVRKLAGRTVRGSQHHPGTK